MVARFHRIIPFAAGTRAGVDRLKVVPAAGRDETDAQINRNGENKSTNESRD